METKTPLTRMRVHRSVVLDNPPSDVRELHIERMRAALPLLGPKSYFCRTSASVLYGLPLWHEDLERVHVVRTGGGHGELATWIHAYTAPKKKPELAVVGGLPVTSLERTTADVMRTLRFGPTLAMADAALRLGASRATLLAEVATGRGCRHCTEAVLRADPRSESPYESWARAIMLQNQLPLPILQKELFDAAGFIGRVDFYWPFAKLCGEFDGEVKYVDLLRPGQTKEDVLRAQELRQQRLEARGNSFIRFGKDEVHDSFVLAARLTDALGGLRVDHGLCPEAMDPPRRRR